MMFHLMTRQAHKEAMADAKPSGSDGGQLFKLATRPKPEPHQWPDITTWKRTRRDGIEQIERTCAACGLVRITILQGTGGRAYRWGDAPFQFDDGVEPECAATIEVVGKT